MMRREELLVREAWLREDAAVKLAFELWEHGDRISLSRLNLVPSQIRQHSEAQLSLEGFVRLRSRPGKDPGEEGIKNDRAPLCFHPVDYFTFFAYLCQYILANLAVLPPSIPFDVVIKFRRFGRDFRFRHTCPPFSSQ